MKTIDPIHKKDIYSESQTVCGKKKPGDLYSWGWIDVSCDECIAKREIHEKKVIERNL